MTARGAERAPRILLADDDATARRIARAVLEDAGFGVEEAEDGTRALAAFDRETPDLVLLDVEMPGLDGLEVCRRLRERREGRHVPVVMATGLDDMASIEAAFAAGATDFIPKPINWALLRHRVRYVLRASRSARELLGSEEKFRLITESSSDFIAMLDREGRRLYSSPSHHQLFGSSDLAGTDSFREIHPEDRDQVREVFRETVASGVGRGARYRWILGDGSVRHLESRGNVIRAPDGSVERVVVVSRDVTERTLQEQKIQRLSRIEAVLSGINSAIVRIRDRDRLLEEACRIAVEHGHLAFAWAGLIDRPTGEITPVAWKGLEQGFLSVGRFSAAEQGGSPLAARAVRTMKPAVSNDVANDTGLRKGKAALERGFRSLVALPLVAGGEAIGLMFLYATVPGFFDEEEVRLLEELAGDISFGLDHMEKEREVHHLAYYDTLTALPNRRLFQETLATLVEARRGGAGKLAVVIIDLRGFHVVNDNLGRHAGDALLRHVGSRIRARLSAADTLGRIGGDQFGIIVSDIPHEAAVGTILERVFAVLRESFRVEGETVHLAFKAGASLFPSDGGGADALLTNAEAALKHAKVSAETCRFYAPELNAAIANRVALVSALERALDSREFTLLYQPKVDFRTGRAVGLEALLYWNEPDGGLTPPGRFIPVLEDTGLILDVGAWVARQAAADLRALRARGLEARIAVNVSPLQFRQKDFPGYLAAAIGADAANGLDIEVTESVTMEDMESCIEVLWQVRRMGLGVALDDFGTGYSSLSYVARLPATELKIDKSFVHDLEAGAARRPIVSAVVSLAHALGMSVVAEGVETPEQARLLRELGCDCAQGYLYSRPAPLDKAASWLVAAPAG
jgi:diguanylate cyclase (GGDEF)-like protein/PAS domain S-box-containing protein